MFAVAALWALVRSRRLRLDELLLQSLDAVDLLLLVTRMLLRLVRVVIHIHIVSTLDQLLMPLVQLFHFAFVTFRDIRFLWIWILSLLRLAARARHLLQRLEVQVARLLAVRPLALAVVFAVAVFVLVWLSIEARVAMDLSLTFL